MANPHDMKTSNRFYDSFIGTLKWTVPLISVIAFIVVLLIA